MMLTPLLKEWWVMGSLLLHQFSCGIVLAFPAVLTPALTNSTGADIHASMDEASWIGASFPMTGGIGFLFLPLLMQAYGRKIINIIINLIMIAGWLVVALAPNVPALIAGRAFQGLAYGGVYITGIITSEYTHPKRRGFFIITKQVAAGVGELFCHGFGHIISWRHIAWLAIIPITIATVSTPFWTESPSWLAYKERYEDCAISFEKMRGKDPESKIEMRKIILAQQEMKRLKKLKGNSALERLMTSLRSAALMKPLRVLLVGMFLAHISGRHFLQAEVTRIMISLTGDKSKAFYYTIIFDCMKILALLASSYFVRKLRRRGLILSAGCLACFLLGLFCLISLLVSKHVIGITWLTPLLLILFNIVCYTGVIPVLLVYKGELIPLEYKGLGVTLVGITSSLTSMTMLKVTSKLLEILAPHGTFAIYMLIAVCCLVVLNIILPETKDRTLQDIELDFTNIKIRDCDDVGKCSGILLEQSK